jgi:hypothetical protein
MKLKATQQPSKLTAHGNIEMQMNCRRTLPQPVQSTALNLSLDKQTEIRYLLVKVLLTVSPFHPSFSPQPRVYRQPFDFAHPLFSWSFELLFAQPLCFDNYLRCPMFLGSAPSSKLWVRVQKLPKLLPCHTNKIARSQVLFLPHIRKYTGVGSNYG